MNNTKIPEHSHQLKKIHVDQLIDMIISSVYSPFSDEVGLSLYNILSPGVLEQGFYDRMPYHKTEYCHKISNKYNTYIHSHT